MYAIIFLSCSLNKHARKTWKEKKNRKRKLVFVKSFCKKEQSLIILLRGSLVKKKKECKSTQYGIWMSVQVQDALHEKSKD